MYTRIDKHLDNIRFLKTEKIDFRETLLIQITRKRFSEIFFSNVQQFYCMKLIYVFRKVQIIKEKHIHDDKIDAFQQLLNCD